MLPDAVPSEVPDAAEPIDSDALESPCAQTLSLTSPASPTYTNGTVTMGLQIDGNCPAPASVSLLANGMQILSLGPSLQAKWDTTTVAEGTYSVVASAMSNGVMISSKPLTVVVDRTRPAILSLTPAPNSYGGSLSAPFKVEFSEPMLASSLGTDAVTITAYGKSVPAMSTLSSDGKTMTTVVTDRSSLSLPAEFTAVVSPQATDLAGNAVAPSPQWTWMVPPWSDFETGLAADSPPVMVVGADSQPVIAYAVIETGTTGPNFMLRVAKLVGTTWTQLPEPSTTPFSGFNGYSLDLDTTGQPTVAWSERGPSDSAQKVHLATWDGATWRTPYPTIAASTAGNLDAFEPHVKLDHVNRPVVAWTEGTATTERNVVLAGRWNGSEWDTSYGVVTEPGAAQHGFCDLALTEGDEPIVSYDDNIKDTFRLATWANGEWLRSPPNPDVYLDDLAVDSMGRPLVATPGSTPGIFLQRLESGTWTQVADVLPAPAAFYSSMLEMAITHDGRPVVGWSDFSAPNRNNLARWTGMTWDLRFGSFGPEQSLAKGLSLIWLAVDPGDNIWTAWTSGGRIGVSVSNY
jgi:hypothetical protein